MLLPRYVKSRQRASIWDAYVSNGFENTHVDVGRKLELENYRNLTAGLYLPLICAAFAIAW